MISNVITLLTHDLAVAFRNKTLYLIVCIPLFVYATLTMVDPTAARNARIRIVLIENRSYPPVFLESIKRAPDEFAVRFVSREEEATRLLKQREADGILIPGRNDASRLRLTVIQQASPETLIIMQRISALQNAAESKGASWIAAVQPLQTGSAKEQTLPTWILMMVLLVSFIILPAQVAEEKEKQLLLGWMQTPVRESEWLAAKLVYGLILMLTSVVAFQLMGGVPSCANGLTYLAILCAGGFCFGALGICIGLLCRTQASARTLGVLCYLPMLLPPALSDMSQGLKSIAVLLPSYHFYEPVRIMFMTANEPGALTRSWISLVVIGLLACLVSHRLIQKRWLM